MVDEIYTHFNKSIDDYDTVADLVVFKNDELHQALVKLISYSKDKPIRVLDLGCGTGQGMKLILGLFPNSFITGVDFSSKMIIKAKETLAGYKNFELFEADFRTFNFPNGLDLVISAIAIHNITHDEKEKLFKNIYSSLKQGGAFLNGDFIEGETPLIQKQYEQSYRDYLEKNLTGHELEIWKKHAFVDDKPMKFSDQFTLLTKVGFKEVAMTWQFNNEAIYCAKKWTA